MKIGVFDSGVGGLSVANAIKRSLPDLDIVLKEDKKHVPYGTRQPQEILGFVIPIFQEMADAGCRIIVVACNTVSTNLIQELRDRFKQVTMIAVEPMIKDAARLSRSGVITVCATPATLASRRYAELKRRYAKDLTVLEPDCHEWAYMIEQNDIDQDRIRTSIEGAINEGSDVIVLGCTHYHWIEKEIKGIADSQAQVIQPEPVIVGQVKQVLRQLA